MKLKKFYNIKIRNLYKSIKNIMQDKNISQDIFIDKNMNMSQNKSIKLFYYQIIKRFKNPLDYIIYMIIIILNNYNYSNKQNYNIYGINYKNI